MLNVAIIVGSTRDMRWDRAPARFGREASTSRRIHDYGWPLVIEVSEPTDESLLDELQRAAFVYFLETVNPTNGLVADSSRENSPSSIAVIGFALSAYSVAVERSWMVRADAVKRSVSVLRFFRDSDQAAAQRRLVTRVSTTTFSMCTVVPASGAPNCR